jgi:hypothetical protein
MRQPLDQPGIFRALDWFANCLFRHFRLPIAFTDCKFNFPLQIADVRSIAKNAKIAKDRRN